MEIDLPEGLSARPPRLQDLPAVHAVATAYERQVLGEPLLDLEDLQADWQRPSFDPERDAVLVADGDRLVGVGEVLQGRATVWVHPDDQGRGVGGALERWCVRTSAAQGAASVGQTVPDADAAAVALLTGRGWAPRWTSWVLELPPGTSVPQRPLPDGYVLRTSRPGDEQAAWTVVEEAFGEWPDREPTSFGDWAATVVERPGFAPEQLLLVESPDGAVVGACHLIVSDGTGWVDQVAVAAEHRGRGLAQALLSAAYATAAERGTRRSELSTDSRTGALTLYERLGMRVRWSFTNYAVSCR